MLRCIFFLFFRGHKIITEHEFYGSLYSLNLDKSRPRERSLFSEARVVLKDPLVFFNPRFANPQRHLYVIKVGMGKKHLAGSVIAFLADEGESSGVKK